MADPLLRPQNLRTAAIFDKATEILAVFRDSVDGDEIADAMEAAASDADLAQAVMYRMLAVMRGFGEDAEAETGVEIVARGYEPSGHIEVVTFREDD